MIVKVQLPLNKVLARETGKAYDDPNEHRLLIYDRDHKHMFQGRDDRLREYMLRAGDGVGAVRAYMQAEWDGARWQIDYEAGFQPGQDW